MKILLTNEQIQFLVKELRVDLINYYYGLGDIEAIVLMDGALVFASDLFSVKTEPRFNIHFLKTESYRGIRSYTPIIKMMGFMEITGKRVLVVDDILDSGKTLRFVIDYLLDMKPKSLDACVLLQKIGRKNIGTTNANFVGAKFYSNEFVVGYGMDLDGKYRDLKDIFIL